MSGIAPAPDSQKRLASAPMRLRSSAVSLELGELGLVERLIGSRCQITRDLARHCPMLAGRLGLPRQGDCMCGVAAELEKAHELLQLLGLPAHFLGRGRELLRG